MLFIIGGAIDAVTDTVSGAVDSITDKIGDISFGSVADLLSDITGLDVNPGLLKDIVTAFSTGGMSAIAEGAQQFGLDSIAEEFGEATGLPVEDVLDASDAVM